MNINFFFLFSLSVTKCSWILAPQMSFAQPQLKHCLWENLLFVPITPLTTSSSSSPIAEYMMMTMVLLKPHTRHSMKSLLHWLMHRGMSCHGRLPQRFLSVSELNQVFAKELEKKSSKKFASMSLNLRKNMEDTSAYFHYVALGFETTRRAFGAIPGSLHADKEQCKELGLTTPRGRGGSIKINWLKHSL